MLGVPLVTRPDSLFGGGLPSLDVLKFVGYGLALLVAVVTGGECMASTLWEAISLEVTWQFRGVLFLVHNLACCLLAML